MKKIALVRGQFLTKYDMSLFESFDSKFEFTAFGSKKPFRDKFSFPTIMLLSPMDIPNFPYKMPILNRIFIDAQYLIGLEEKLKGFDLVHTSETYFRFTQQALNAKDKGYVKKVVCTVFENIPFNNEGIWGRKSYKKRAIEGIDHFVAVTKGAKSALVSEGISEAKIDVIPMGIDLNLFKPGNSFGKISDKKNIEILFVGRIEVFKGILDVISVMNNLSKDKELKDYRIQLILVGKGSKLDEVKALVKKLGLNRSVAYKRRTYDNIIQEYQRADIFIGPSRKDKYWQEQFGMVFLEAMACGIPIVSYKSGSIPEVVGDSGFLAEEEDVKALTEFTKKLIQNPTLRTKKAKQARERAEKLFDIKNVSKRMEEVYNSLI